MTAAMLLPVVATASVQTIRASYDEPRERPVRAGTAAWEDVLYPIASRSAVRSAMVAETVGRAVSEAAPPEAALHLRKGEVGIASPKGTRVWTVSALSDHGLPLAAERAYKHAAALMAQSDPSCRLPWTLVAGIGRVESDHGRYGGARLDTNGVSRPRIIGVALDGVGPVAAVPDTDNGKYDGDKVWDHAVGPMQFLPSTWAYAARDGDGDGRMSPFDIDDAAAATAAYLCSGSGDLSDPVQQAAAIYRYNQDDYYVALVQAFEVGYRTGRFVIPPMPVEPDQKAKHHKRHQRAKDKADHARARHRGRPHRGGTTVTTSQPAVVTLPQPAPKPAPKPAPGPSPSPAPAPKPTPSPPSPAPMTGVLTQDAAGYYLGGKLLDLGIVGNLTATAVGDFDKDTTVETNQAELEGMLGNTVTMTVVTQADGKLGIYSINGIPLG